MDELHQGAELAEATMMAQVDLLAPPEIKASKGIALTRVAGATVLSMREDPTRYWSKAVGFVEPVTARQIDEVIDFYRSENNPRAVIQVPPFSTPDDWVTIVEKYGLTRGSMIVKLGARLDEVADHATDLPISEITPDQADEWSATALEGFGMTGVGLEPVIAELINLKGHHMYAAWDGGKQVGTGAVTVYGTVAYGNTAATLPAYRGRGAQSALIARRARDAAEWGCAWYVSDTGMPDEGDTSNHSYNNMRRAGMRILYTRRNWIWTA